MKKKESSRTDISRYVSLSRYISLQDYLQTKYRQGSIVTYKREIKRYLQYNPEAKGSNYTDIINYIGYLREQKFTPCHIQNSLQAIKQYYHFLLKTGQRKTHPCRYLILKDSKPKPIQLQDLFKPEELEQLMERKEHYKNVKIKNQVIISLLIEQGLTTGEIVRIETTDINLDKAEIYIKGTAITNRRTLKLQTKQIMLFYKYINEERPKLLKGETEQPVLSVAEVPVLSGAEVSRSLIITWQGTAENGEGISYLVSTYKYLFPDRNLNPKTIRQSVITNLLKQGHDLRKVQYFAGHKYPSTTEKYRQTGIEELKAGIEKYHPLQ